MKRIIAMMLCLVMVLMTSAMAEEVIEPTVIALGETMNLLGEEAQAENVSIAWTTSDETIVAVDEAGATTALNAGEAVVTANVTTTISDTVDQVVVETVEETDAATGETTTKEVEKTVAVEVEKEITEEKIFVVVVEAAACPCCAAEYVNAEEYAAHIQTPVCGVEGHYVCDGQDHESELDIFCNNEDPHRACEAGVATHDCAACGATYACEDSGSHTTCIACGNAWCYKDEGDHATPHCGKVEHRPCMLDDFNTSEHRRCRHCNAMRCNGAKHGKGKCVPAED